MQSRTCSRQRDSNTRYDRFFCANFRENFHTFSIFPTDDLNNVQPRRRLLIVGEKRENCGLESEHKKEKPPHLAMHVFIKWRKKVSTIRR